MLTLSKRKFKSKSLPLITGTAVVCNVGSDVVLSGGGFAVVGCLGGVGA